MVAALAAIIVGPLVSLRVTRKQNENSLEIARRQNETSIEVAKQQSETTLRATRQQIRADVISASRHRWMDAFRDVVAEFLSTLSGWAVVVQTGAPTPQDLRPVAERVTYLSSKISLLLNPEEAEHQHLVDLLNKFLKTFDEAKGDPKSINPVRKEITQQARTILKGEWERTKTEPDEW